MNIGKVMKLSIHQKEVEMSQATSVPPSVNKAMKFILRSPLHGMVSKSILLITFTGRKSGKTYTTPVSYSQSGNQVTIFTHASWWKNLRTAAPVTLHIQGQDRQGFPEAIVEDKRAISAELAAHLQNVPSDARWYGVTFDENKAPRVEDIAKAVESVVMIHVQLC